MSNLDLFNDQLIGLSSSYLRSTNIELDYKDSSKLNSIFITPKFEQGLLEVLTSINDPNSNHRVRVLSGSPGLGKSTYALLMANVVSKQNPVIIKRLIENYSKKELLGEFKKFQGHKKSRLLPVFLNGFMGALEDAFTQSLRNSFLNIGLEKEFEEVLKDSSRNQIEILNKWKKSYPEIYEKYLTLLKREVESLEDFEKKLKKGVQSVREIFGRIYTEVTGGASHQKVESNITSLFQNAIRVLSENGYAGIYVIYDEFGKYLEKGVHIPSALNVQFLQDFAEYCDRSGKNQCHLTLITHLSDSQYASKFPIAIQKEWAKIEGRFQESSFYDKSTNHYKMVSLVFERPLKEGNSSLFKKWKLYADKFFKEISQNNLGFGDFLDSKAIKEIIERCYPLHPATLALLPPLTQKVAQNERTLYTFLTRDEDYSLKRFLSNGMPLEDLRLLMPSDLFSYFSSLIAKDVGIGGTYKIQLIVEEAFGKIRKEDQVSKEILSFLGLASVIKNYSFAPLTKGFIHQIFSGDFKAKEIEESLNLLHKKKIILFNKILNQYELHEGSSVDIDEEISKLKAKTQTSKELVRIIKHFYSPDFIVPKKYNFDHNTTRFYKADLISVEELTSLKQDLIPDYSKEDGLVFYVLPFNTDELALARKLVNESKRPLTIFVLPKTFIECKKDIEELNAINSLYNNSDVINSGHLVRKELDRHKNNILLSLEKLLDPLIGQRNLNIEIYYPLDSMRASVNHFSFLQRALGNIFEKEYNLSVDFNSEYTNKHKITGNISLARKMVIDGFSKNPLDKNLGLEGNGPEVALRKALYGVSNFKYNALKGHFELKRDSQLGKVLGEYKKLLLKNKGGFSAEKIIETLIAPPLGIRKGIIPLVLGLFDRSLPFPVNHYFEDRFITVLDGDHYDLIQKNPKNCKIQYSEIHENHQKYLEKLSAIFGNKDEKNLRSLIESIVTWRASIPEYSKNVENKSPEAKKFLIYIDSAKEPDKLIFEKLPEAVGFNPVTEVSKISEVEDICKKIEKTKNEVSGLYRNLLEEIRNLLIGNLKFWQTKCLGEKPKDLTKDLNLAKVLQETFNRFSPEVQNHPFSEVTLRFIGRLKSFDPEKQVQYFFETLADALTGSNPRNWNTEGKSLFEFALKQSQNELEMVNEFLNSRFNGKSAIAFIQRDTGKKDFIRLGICSKIPEELNEISKKIEDSLKNIEPKERINILLNLLAPQNEEIRKENREEHRGMNDKIQL